MLRLIFVQMVYFGVPSAAALSVELFKQWKSPQASQLYLPRSEVIQNLSIFAGCMNWVRPMEANHALLSRTRKVITRILDQVLASPPAQGFLSDANLPDIELSSIMPADDPDFLDWLNNVDWTTTAFQ